MSLEFQPTEIISNIFLHCPDIPTVLTLSSTCHRFRQIYNSSQKLPILERAVDAQYGPVADIIQLVTHNNSQPAHVARSVPTSFALIKQIFLVGRVAEQWCDIYPFKKWKYNYEDRRLLTNTEKLKLRRALYRLWLYSRAFHNGRNPRTTRMLRPILDDRAELLHNWSTEALAEMADVHAVLREVVHNNVCPSNGTIARKFRKRHPEYGHDQQLLFNIHLNYPPPQLASHQPSSPHHNPLATNHHASYPRQNTRYFKYVSTPHHDPGAEGWGDDIGHYYVVEDMMKLNPEQILWLKNNAPVKKEVELYVKQQGEWFENNGETWTQTLHWVLGNRGNDVEEFEDRVRDGEWGITSWED
jgi:hypothetical protein